MDTSNGRIQKWFPGASYGTTIISSTTMNSPIGFGLDLSGNYFIADTSNHRILQFGLICRKSQSLFLRSSFNNKSFQRQQQRRQYHHQVKHFQ